MLNDDGDDDDNDDDNDDDDDDLITTQCTELHENVNAKIFYCNVAVAPRVKHENKIAHAAVLFAQDIVQFWKQEHSSVQTAYCTLCAGRSV